MLLRRLLVEDEGQTLVEYGLLVALIALVVIAALTLLGQENRQHLQHHQCQLAWLSRIGGRGDGRPFVDGEEPLNSVRPNGRNKPQEVTVMLLRRLLVEDEGQTLVEYGLLVALIALVVIAALTLLGQQESPTPSTPSMPTCLVKPNLGAG
jgi:pilus assembly protein Flp/PilA